MVWEKDTAPGQLQRKGDIEADARQFLRGKTGRILAEQLSASQGRAQLPAKCQAYM